MADIERAAARVRRFVTHRVPNQADAEDIAQQTFLLAMLNHRTFRGGSFDSWLFTIARHLIVDHYRAQSRFAFVQTESGSSDEGPLQTAADGVATACDSRARLRCWLTCVSRHLRMDEQVAVLAADWYGYQDKESAELLGMSLPRFKLLLHGARARLHRQTCELPMPVAPPATRSCHGGRADQPSAVLDDRHNTAQPHDSRPAAPEHAPRRPRRPPSAPLLALRARLLEGLSTVLLSLGFDPFQWL